MSLASNISPELLFDFPPFYTLQPISATRSMQISAWSKKLIELAQLGSSPSSRGLIKASPASLSIFTSSKLSRTLSPRGIRAVFLNLQDKNLICWDNSSFSLSYSPTSPSDPLAQYGSDTSSSDLHMNTCSILGWSPAYLSQIFLSWIKQQVEFELNVVYTFYEIMETLKETGEQFLIETIFNNSEGNNVKISLASLDQNVFHFVFQYLQSIDKVFIIYGETHENDGIKILAY